MKNYLILLLSWLLAVFLWLWNVPPAFYAPLVPELIMLGLMFLLLPSPSQILRRFQNLPPLLKISAALFTSLLVVSLMRGFYEWISISRIHPLCLAMPGMIQRLECLFGAAADQNYAPRTMLTLFTGAFAFFATIVMGAPQRQMVLRAIQLGGVAFACASYLAHFGFINIPAGFFDSPFQYRFCYFIGNPSWMAPFLAPSLLASLVFIIQGRHRALNAMASLLMLDVILRSQQRGGLVIVLIFISFLVVFSCRQLMTRVLIRMKNYKKILAFSLVAAAGILLFAIPFIWQLTTKALQTLGFGDRLSSSGFVSGERIIIWKAAWGELQGKLLFGHGYASWYRSGASQVPRYGLHQYFDTAHNFFVQFLFEHGIISLSVWVLAAILMIVGLWRHSSSRVQWTIGAIIVLFLPILLTQEVDFLRSGFYLTMTALGCAVSSRDHVSDSELTPPQAQTWQYLTYAIAVALVGSGIVFFAAFSTGGYQYEANAVYGYGPRVRWFRQNGDINFVSSKAKSRSQFALYPVQSINAKTMNLTSEYLGGTYEIDFSNVKPNQLNYVPIAARSALDMSDSYSLDSVQVVDGRQLGILLNWPPLLTTMPVTKVLGAKPGDFQSSSQSAIEQGFWCGEICELDFLACSSGRTRKIYALAKTPGIHDNVQATSDLASDQKIKVDVIAKELPIPVNHHLKLQVKAHEKGDMSQLIFVFGGTCE